MDTDPSAAPPVDPALFERARADLAADGPLAAVDRLCDRLRSAGDYHNLFYAMLMRKRVELGLPPFPTGPSADLPLETHEPYEAAIREAARHVGRIYLENRDLPRAWGFFRLIGEPEPVKEALAGYTPGPDEDTYPLVDIAWHQQVLPQKGFDLILDRNGVCSAITMVGSADLNQHPDLRAYCVRRLVRTLYEQLQERVRADLQSRGLPAPSGASVAQLIAGRDELFADDAYHIDVSHLSSVVQMATHLPPGEELDLARELCEYGCRLAPQYRGEGDAPFEGSYADYLVYLDTVAGRDVDAGLAHFQGKVARELEDGNTFPAEVYVNLLLKLDRPREALAAAREYLGGVADERSLSCPGVTELARRVGDYDTVAEASRAKGDPVTFLAGLIAGRSG
jgi:hypothetical protein